MDATPIIIKRKKAHAHAHHGGSWKVAYADFVTAMMAFFMVMWIMGLSDDTRAQIQGYFNDPIGFAKNQPRARTVIQPKGMPQTKPGRQMQNESTPYQNDHKAMQKLKHDLERALQANPELKKLLEHLDIQITDEGLRIEFLEDKSDFFELGKAVLTPGALKVIHALGPVLARSGRPMVIEGHTDSVPFAGDPYRNFQLSTERASALQLALGHTGVPLEKFEYVKGLADRELRDPKHPTSGVNRRVTILLPFVTNLTSSQPMPQDEVRDMMSDGVRPTIHLAPHDLDLVHDKK